MTTGTVYITIDGTRTQLTYNAGTGAWEAQIQAPGKTSFNQPGGYYNALVEATNTAGTTGSADGSTIEGLRLKVLEKIKPVITITSPTSGAYITNAQQPITGTVVDEVNGSGVDPDTLVVKLDGVVLEGVQTSAITNGYSFTVTPPTMNQGSRTVTVEASDNDGNAADIKSVTFTVDTIPPTLNITSPSEGLITNTQSVTVAGVTNDATSSPVTVKISLNGQDQGTVTVGSGGNFSKVVNLREGDNVIVVTATDAAGKSSSVTRNVKLDTTVPKIISATITPNPADTGATMIVKVVIE